MTVQNGVNGAFGRDAHILVQATDQSSQREVVFTSEPDVAPIMELRNMLLSPLCLTAPLDASLYRRVVPRLRAVLASVTQKLRVN